MLPRRKLEKILNRVREIECLLNEPEVVRDPARAHSLTKELSGLSKISLPYRELLQVEREIGEVESLLKASEGEGELGRLYREERENLQRKKGSLEESLIDQLVKEDPDVQRNAIVEIRAGTGGEEAALFTGDLFRMYSKYAQAQGFQLEVMSAAPSAKGGFKEIIFGISGPGAFRKFRFESGTHRVQRVPETEAGGRIHTSAVTVAVLPEAEEVDVEINPSDLLIDTFRSSGPGGQHVNKTDSAVRLTHVPSGLVVSCQDEKSQHKNKAKALRVLRTRLLEMKRKEQEREVQESRRKQVGSGDRSEKIRTYNFPDRRVTDHRIGLTLHNPDDILNGHLDELIDALELKDRERHLADEAHEA